MNLYIHGALTVWITLFQNIFNIVIFQWLKQITFLVQVYLKLIWILTIAIQKKTPI
ncbi:MAG: hypothetical protein EXX96DRAFT_565237 [Benjaminiella poitrasii]|nr:MAG: hypothetical protein EXX96DRAFT_565237 [Benjaminiella poitrasii]